MKWNFKNKNNERPLRFFHEKKNQKSRRKSEEEINSQWNCFTYMSQGRHWPIYRSQCLFYAFISGTQRRAYSMQMKTAGKKNKTKHAVGNTAVVIAPRFHITLYSMFSATTLSKSISIMKSPHMWLVANIAGGATSSNKIVLLLH